jgi:type I restriction enzyme S subunit
MREYIAGQNTGSSVPLITLGILRSLPVILPPLSTQHRIAAILSAYDDLIENNTHRMAILEEMARLIYREWFVHFRFPGHEDVKMVDSELGPMPEGWEVVRVSDAVEVNPRMKVPKDGQKPYLPMASLSERSMLIQDIEYRDGNSGSKYRNGDTLFARITPSLENGKTGFVQFLESSEAVGLGSTEFIVLRSRTVCPEYVYMLARWDPIREHAIKSMTGASGRQRVQTTCFDDFLIAHPDKGTLEHFAKLVGPFFQAVHCLARNNEILRCTRDLLLPSLVRGEIDVSELAVDG